MFASFAEQRGFFGAAILLLLYLLVVWRGLRVITVAGDLYGAMVAGGIVFAFLFQVFVNVGMTMGIAPVTGIPLPFVTVGGSSMVANLVAVGILQGIHLRGRAGDVAPPMTPLPFSPRDVLALRRHVRSSEAMRGPLLVTGTLADQLARQLGAGAEPGAVRTARRPAARCGRSSTSSRARPTPDDERVLRAATRALIPLVVVQIGDPSARLPYVLATDVVTSRAGEGLPDRRDREDARAHARDGRRRSRALAARAPRRVPGAARGGERDQRRRPRGARAGTCPSCRCSPSPRRARCPTSRRRAVTSASDGPAGSAATVGAAARGRARARVSPRVHSCAASRVRNRAVEAAVAAAATYALATVFRRLGRR